MVEQQPSKLNTRVRFPSPAPNDRGEISSELTQLDLPNGDTAARRNTINTRGDPAEIGVPPVLARPQNMDW
jgi:hypothetical protein